MSDPRAEGVRTIVVDRPEAKNALLPEMRVQMATLLDAADRDPHVSVVVLTGTDPVFTAGVDFKDIAPPTTATRRSSSAILERHCAP
jgi:enoyl-CoA hydratase